MIEFSFPQLVIKGQYSKKEKIDFPYISNFFAFSVGPIILSLMEKIKKPYIALFPGRGVAHPRGLGLASHLGLLSDVPSIACSKKGLWTKDLHIDLKKGSFEVIRNSPGKTEGAVVITKDNTEPMFVSCGHRISIKKAVEIILKCSTEYRIPEPLRLASIFAKKF